MHAFTENVFEWIGNVNDYYILYLRYLNQNFEPITSTVPLEIVHDSDRNFLCGILDE